MKQSKTDKLVPPDQRALLLVSAFDHETASVIRQQAVPRRTNEQKAVLDLWKQLVLTGRVITADAMHCEPQTCRQILDSGGHYLITVKDNQSTLHQAISQEFTAPNAVFSPYQQRQREAERETFSQPDKGHGRRERRTLESTTGLNQFLEQSLGWTGIKQAFRITRRRTTRDRETGHVNTTTEVVYGITSLSRDQADAEKLLALNRRHWGIENKLHWVRDVVFDEDRCRIRTNHGPQQLATAPNAAIALCRVSHYHQIAAARREFAWNASRLFAILGFLNL